MKNCSAFSGFVNKINFHLNLRIYAIQDSVVRRILCRPQYALHAVICACVYAVPDLLIIAFQLLVVSMYKCCQFSVLRFQYE